MDTIDSQIKLKNLDDVIDSAEVTLARAYTERAIFKIYKSTPPNYFEAILDLDKAIEIEPWALNYFDRGHTHYCLGHLEQALSDLTNSLNSYQREEREGFDVSSLSQAMIQDYLGVCYNALGQYEKAVREYNSALESSPPLERFGHIFHNRALALSNLGRYREAIQDHTKSIKLDSNNPLRYYERGITLSLKHRYKRSLMDINRAFELGLNNCAKERDLSLAHHTRGFALFKLRRYEEAFLDLNQAIQLCPQSAHSYSWRGAIYERRGEMEPATRDYQAALNLLEEVPVDKFNLRNIEHLIRVTEGLTRLGVDKSDLTAKYKELEKEKR